MDNFIFESPSLAVGAFRVLSIVGEEAISAPFRFEVVVLVLDHDADDIEARVIGQPARLQLRRHDGLTRFIVGVVRSIRSEGGHGASRRFRLELVPLLWLFGERHGRRIFQDRTVPEIVQALLEELHVRFDFRLVRTYLPREYCVQYDESDVDFITRILGDEGIFFYFEGDESTMTMVFGDKESAYLPIAGEHVLRNRDGGLPTTADERVSGFVVQRSVRAGSVTLRDYDFKRPSLDLTARVLSKNADALDSSAALEQYEFPGGYLEADEGRVRAQVRLDELRWDADLASALGTTRRLEPGHHFLLEDHPRDSFNRTWVVTRVRHEGHDAAGSLSEAGASSAAAQFSYRATFESIPASVTFRPRPPPRRSVHGVETARVQGAGGSEEILVDEHGRILVQFPWDRVGAKGSKTSCFIRVAHAWAGTGFGVVFLPRVGMEVVVSFLGGDPDKPLITGCVYNGEHPLPYKLPEHKTRSTIKTLSSPGGNGFNELRFEDKSHAEEIFLHAQKDLNEVVRNNHSESVGSDESISVGHDQSTVVKNDQSVRVIGKQTNFVGKLRQETIMGPEIVHVELDRTETVNGNETITLAKNRFHSVLGNDDLSVMGSRTTTVTDDDTFVATNHIATAENNYAIKAGTFFGVEQGAIEFLLKDTNMYSHADHILSDAGAEMSLGSEGTWAGFGLATTTLWSNGEVCIKVGSNVITIRPDGIEISGDPVVVVKAPTIRLRSTGRVSVSGPSIDVDADGEVNIKGGTINLNV